MFVARAYPWSIRCRLLVVDHRAHLPHVMPLLADGAAQERQR
jgi:hypothetical protein